MLALEIRLNGELKATCGTGAIERLVGLLTARRGSATLPKDFEFRVECQGRQPVSQDVNEAVKWVSTKVQLGDEVSFRFVDVASADEPFDRQELSQKRDPSDA
jgi:hypothetical protein